MSTTEHAAVEAPAPNLPAAPKKKRTKRPARKRATVAKPQMPDEFAGLTLTNCPTACRAEHCVISCEPVCAHPRKGGLQGTKQYDQAAVARFLRAKNMLAKAEIDRRS